MVEVRRVRDRVMTVVVVFDEDVLRLICGYAPQSGGYGVGQRNFEGRMLLEFYLGKELCVSNTWFKREGKRKVTFRMGENEKKIDFVLIKKEHR